MPYSFNTHLGNVVMNLPTVNLEAKDLLPYLGMPSLDNASSMISNAIDQALELVHPLLQPIAIWGLLKVVEVTSDQVILACPNGEKHTLIGEASFMEGCDGALLSVVSIGELFDSKFQELEDDPLVAMALDAAGSAAISLSGKTYRKIQSEHLLEYHLEIGPTFSPGCQVFPLTTQRQLFDAISPEKIGVHLTEDYLMQPRKSVSYINPVGVNLPKKFTNLKPCSICSKRKDCNMKGLSIE